MTSTGLCIHERVTYTCAPSPHFLTILTTESRSFESPQILFICRTYTYSARGLYKGILSLFDYFYCPRRKTLLLQTKIDSFFVTHRRLFLHRNHYLSPCKL